ncbi:MAG: 16S rRNA (adenine(1518)-N(6)/adenine(1519)-N(6))-dimethyltransferase RsmA [Planctomycetes bacterium]|jgi:16S rRNA (adenine1518-N6/adenine1519-N6)-dimethyltransferase|nr:16S rRNA (adenine(1518)-N(6)/adenine(1519)-N(6))-dimethyltransferase RsmA [Planctomycetota bacterium]
MDILKQTLKLCDSYGIKPSRNKGQNFLIDETVYKNIITAADLQQDEYVLEVGPGFGFLTERLVQKAKQVIAVELDDNLVRALKNRLAEQGIKNVEVKNEDILKISDISARGGFASGGQYPISNKIPNDQFQKAMRDARCAMRGYKIVANLPYNITSHFLRKFLSEEELRPSLMVLMLQKEVAQRICAKSGEMSLLAVSVQFYTEPKIIEYVPKCAFWPEPAVDSAIIRLTPRPLSKFGEGWPEAGVRDFFRLVKFGFSARRKMLKNNLAAGYKILAGDVEKILKTAGLGEKIRAQDLSVQDWLKLFGYFKSIVV